MSNQMEVRIILKSGVDFVTKCDKFTLKTDVEGNPTGYEISGISENAPIYLNFNEIAAIVRVFSNEAY